MTTVEFSPAARRDFERLRPWLEERAPQAAESAIKLLFSTANALAEFPERGRMATRGLRELIIPFGPAGYVLRYGVRRNRVIIARVFHSLERR